MKRTLLWIGLAGGGMAALGGLAGWSVLTACGAVLLLGTLLLLPWLSEGSSQARCRKSAPLTGVDGISLRTAARGEPG